MKLSIAAGILAQTLPVVSETKISALLDRQHAGRKLQLGDITRRARAANADGAQKERKVKARTRRSKKKSAASFSPGALKNAPVASSLIDSESVDLVVCDPSSTDPDVGVLSCGSGKMCKRSQDSVLGGICMAKKPSVDPRDPRVQAAQEAKNKKRGVESTEKSSSGKLKNALQGSTSTRAGFAACDPSSTNADTGVLSCGKGRFCKPNKSSDLGGECADRIRSDSGTTTGNGGALKKARQNNKGQAGLVECDPAAPDLGILSCGPDESCVKNQDSNSGGFCVNPGRTARGLIHLTEDVGLCDPTSDDYGIYPCDCSSFDNTAKTGTISCNVADNVCFGDVFYGCYETCGAIQVTYDFEASSLSSLKYCYTFSTSDTESICVTYGAGFATCETEYNGQSCTSCEVLESDGFSFDCSNTGGPSASGGRPIISTGAIEACYEPVEDGEYCKLCGYDSNGLVPYANNNLPVFLRGFGDTTCYGLVVASRSNQISAEKCSEASAVARSSCCETTCDICSFKGLVPPRNYGNPVTVPGLGDTTCGELIYAAYQSFSLPDGSCPAASDAAAAACCEPFCELCSTSFIPLSRSDIPVSIPGFESITTCSEMDSAAYMDLTIPGESCPAFAEIAENSCCLYSCDICGPTAVITSEYYENIFSVPIVGNMTCGELQYGAYQNSSLDSDSCSVVAGYAREACCFDFTGGYCSVCGPNGLIPYAYDEYITTIPGVGNATCYGIFLAAYYGEPPLNATCPVLSEVAQESCCRRFVSSCELCSPYSAIPYENDDISVTVPGGGGNGTCYELYYGAYVYSTGLENETCQAFSEVARESCCESVYFDPCYLCGPGQNVSNPFFYVTSPVSEDSSTCGFLESYALLGYFDETECAYFSSLAVEPCCDINPSPVPTDTFVDEPTSAPVMPAGSAGMPKSLVSVRTTASVMALTTATCLWLAT